MKARSIAGDLRQADAMLRELQSTDWQRYGLAGRSRAELREMRMRLEREQGSSHPLKAGSGGYYDMGDYSYFSEAKQAEPAPRPK